MFDVNQSRIINEYEKAIKDTEANGSELGMLALIARLLLLILGTLVAKK